MTDSVHDKLSRIRKPRVHITFDVEKGDSTVKKELPFVVGVMGDYSGDATENRQSLKDRKFVEIDRDSFNNVMEKVNPKLDLKVPNTLEDDNSEMAVNLDFKALEDFEPQNLVEQIKPLKELLDARNKLRDLLSKADRSEELESILEQVLQHSEKSQTLSDLLKDGDNNGGNE